MCKTFLTWQYPLFVPTRKIHLYGGMGDHALDTLLLPASLMGNGAIPYHRSRNFIA